MIKNILDQKRSLTLHICSGMISSDDIEKEIRLLYENDPTDNHLWDLTQADLTNIASSEVVTLAQLPAEVAPNRKGRKTAIVAVADLEYALSRMFQIHSEIEGPKAKIEIFKSIKEAQQWIEAE